MTLKLMKLLVVLVTCSWVSAVMQSSAVCDVIVAGGSLASLAAAVTAANVSAALQVCFLDPTDWPGGQLTASAVPAVDFGPMNGTPENNANSFASFLWGALMPAETNLGACWVSKKCFLPTLAMDSFVFPLLRSLPNIAVYLRTAVSFAVRDAASGNVTSIVGITRTPVVGTTGWETTTSAQLADWYDPSPSAAFTKTVTTFNLSPGGVVVEATEFGDVLMTAGLPVAQGIEIPAENSTSYQSYCGQASTVPFYITYSEELAPSPDPWPAGSNESLPYSQQGMNWAHDWIYRRVQAAANASASRPAPGEISVINVGHGDDYDNGYLFYSLTSPEVQSQLRQPFAWRGGVNITALAAAEQRSYGFYHWYVHNVTVLEPSIGTHFQLNASQAGTGSGLAKMPYLRDSRRSGAGIDQFRVFYANLSAADPADNTTAVHWPDAVGIGQYFYADIHTMTAETCPLPSYLIPGAVVKPYYIPFRALTVDGAPNLLVCGKSMAMSFWANAAMRLHPEEWTSGVAAGTAAALMVRNGWDTSGALANIQQVQAVLIQQGQPLKWTFP